MSLASIQIPEFISYCSPVQGRMAGASTSVYKFDNMVRGQDVYENCMDSTHEENSVSASCLGRQQK